MRKSARLRSPVALLTLAIILAGLGGSPAAEISAGDFSATYTRYQHRIPMREGVGLFTTVYAPKDTGTNYPILLTRTPYGQKPYTIDTPDKTVYFPDSIINERFILVVQDVRGRFASEGEFTDVRPIRPERHGS